MKCTSLAVLESFPECGDLQEHARNIGAILESGVIKSIKCFALGPEGTNISQAAVRWASHWIGRPGVRTKFEIILCDTPESSLEQARKVDEEGVMGLFGTCAVYYSLNKLFFENPDALPFFAEEVMNLDEMQLATTNELAQCLSNSIPYNWQIASHPSPAPLVRNLGCQIVLVNSNAKAADEVKAGNVQLCITTESARESRGLVKLHSFGSPPMVFFYGIVGPSIQVFRSACLAYSQMPIQDAM